MSKASHQNAFRKLREFALGFPEAYEEQPWGHSAIKVKGKTFVFLALHDGFGLSAKLPESHPEALLLPFASPTRYGLGKSGWVSAQIEEAGDPPVSVLADWIEESYRTIAPRRLVAQLDGEAPAPAKKKATSGARKKAKKKVASKSRAAARPSAEHAGTGRKPTRKKR